MLDNLFIDTHFPKLSHTRHDTDLEKSIKFGQMFLPSKLLKTLSLPKNGETSLLEPQTHRHNLGEPVKTLV